jgi:hypothetical protein
MKPYARIAILAGLSLTIGLAGLSCKKIDQSVAAFDEVAAADKPTAEAPEPPPKPAPPKVTDDIYVDVTARTALIWEKYKDDAPTAEKTVEALYEKLGITADDYKTFQVKLTPQKSLELQKKVQEFMQKILDEYR